MDPYLAKRLDAFHEAEQGYEDAIKQVDDRVWSQLQNGSAPGFDFRRAKAASEKERNDMAVEYISRQLKDDATVAAANERLAKQAMVVPAALDLGMVTLQRAQSLKDPAARRTELERAEKTFLAIRGTAGESDKYMLHLGQVYYWLGKQKEGREEFDKLLAKHQRKAEILLALARVLRNLGAMAEARKSLEEAYEKTPDEKLRHGIAHLRAITSTGSDDEIQWLERCDARDVFVKALLAEARGRRAEVQGKDDDAAANYREAVAIYERQPESATVLNNGALASLALFAITGDRQALERGTQWLEKAVSLSPMDSLVLGNAAHQILQAAIQDLAGNRLNLRELQMSDQISALYFLANDQKSLDEIRRRSREHAGLRKSLEYFRRVNVLAPKNVGNNYSALAVYSFLRDREELQKLARSVADSKPDVEEVNASMLKYYRYQDQEFSKEKVKAKTARAEALVMRLSGRDKGPAYAAAVDRLVDLQLSQADEGGLDADAMVRSAEDAHLAAPSMATYGALINALMHRASRKLAADYPEYANATRGSGRAASVGSVVALAMGRNDALGKSARDNQDVQRAIALAATRAEAFPESRSCWEWVVLGAAEPSRAELRAKCRVPDELEAIARQIGQALVPINPHLAFESYWQRLAAGEANARAPLDQLVKLGVPLPVNLIQAESGKK